MVLDAKGYGRLTDFGIAQQLKEEKNYMCTVGSGTLGYMAPEQASSAHEHSFEADWWQLGIVTFEFLMGSRPQPNSGPERKLVDYVYKAGKAVSSDTHECDNDPRAPAPPHHRHLRHHHRHRPLTPPLPPPSPPSPLPGGEGHGSPR